MTWTDLEQRLQELNQAIEEHFARITLVTASVQANGLTLSLDFSGVYYVGKDALEQPIDECWDVHAQDVQEHQLALGSDLLIPQVQRDHPRLRGHLSAVAGLYYAAPPTRPNELVSELFRVHDPAEYGPFGMYGPYGNVEVGYGELASGPQALMDAYLEVLEKQGMRPNILSGTPASTSNEVQLLNLSGEQEWAMSCFVLARSFTANRVR
ncbi:hypothetical protein [Deinococcus hohokamensis]|uniref:Uncharacterized protein n=1 Tax=Deinococcus hohokamensis TaxID=309883 RepID=A0ABV9ICZ5_9DEIO